MKTWVPAFLIALVLALAEGFAGAQQRAKVPRIGILGEPQNPSSVISKSFRQGLNELGYVEQQNVILEPRFSSGQNARYHDLAAELVGLQADVIVAHTSPAIYAVMGATRTIPIVMTSPDDPVTEGIVRSLEQPSGNVTGVSGLVRELGGKWLELLKETFPTISSVVILVRKGGANYTPFLGTARKIEVTARSLDVKVESIGLRDAEIENIFSSMAKRRASAFILNPHPMFSFHRDRIVNSAAKSRVPGMYPNRTFVEAGGLLSYVANMADLFRRVASYVDKILRGANPARFAGRTAHKFEFVINLRAARHIGVTILPEILMWADEVIK
jgi:putative tryptophan/tyrosine transport system substrate-binding protein